MTHTHIVAYKMTPQPQSPQEMYDEPAKGEEKHDAGPEDPFVLLGPPLDHADGVAADAQRVGDAVQLPLRALEHLALLAQIAEHGPAALEVFVQLRVGGRHEALLAQRVRFARLVRGRGAERERAPRRRRRRRGGERGGVGKGGLRVGVFGGGGVVGTSAEEFGAVVHGLLRGRFFKRVRIDGARAGCSWCRGREKVGKGKGTSSRCLPGLFLDDQSTVDNRRARCGSS